MISTSAESLIRVATAIRQCHEIEFAYRSHLEKMSNRRIEPYAITHTDGRWYLIGHCLAKKALRTFRLDRVSDLSINSTKFKRPKNFEAAK